MRQVLIRPKQCIHGELIPPGDKSISHRAVMFGALAEGKSVFSHFLNAEDCLATIAAFTKMGVTIKIDGDVLSVKGVGIRGLKAPQDEIYLGNSGTSMRLLSGMLAAQSFTSVLTGDESLSKRPMDRIIGPLKRMGAFIEGNGVRQTAPLHINGRKLHGIEFDEDRGSAQIKSSILLAGLYAEGKTVVNEVKPSRDHTERMLYYFKAPFEKKGERCVIKKTPVLYPQSFTIPGDISSAAFFIVAALLLQNSEIVVKNVGLNPTRTGVLSVLKKMGAKIEIKIDREGLEPMGSIIVRSSQLRGIKIDYKDIPFLIDELPIIMVAAACADGETIIEGAGELRIKETDRIKSMFLGLTALGVSATEIDDGIIIQGKEHLSGGVSVDSFNDHRTAMSLAIASLLADAEVTINGTECVTTSYPEYFNTLEMITH